MRIALVIRTGAETLRTQTLRRGFAPGGSLAWVAKLIAWAALCIAPSALETRADEPARSSSPSSATRWSGAYIGGHLGYAWGNADWTAYGPGAAITTGGFDFGLAYDAFKGTGSYYGGLQAGYNYRLPSGIVIGF